MKKQMMRTLLMLGLFAMAGVANAQAQARNEFRAQVPFTFTVNNRVFPAGEYSFERTPTGSSRDVLAIRNLHEARARMYVLVISEELARAPEESTLIFNLYEGGG